MTRKTKTKISLFLTTIITLYSLFTPLMDVKADGSYNAKLTTGGVRLRTAPTTDKNPDSSTNIIDTLDDGIIITVLSSTKVAGTGCADGWLNVSFNNETGYVCSQYVTTDLTDSFNRPWNTPKKAIMGGAKFIAEGYIKAGQFTSYLKKFNVNSNGYYDIYNHQYQTNVMAPYSEAQKAQKAYSNASMMDLTFTFNIPVYDEMAASYTCANCSQVNPEDNTDKVNSVFETEMKNGFSAAIIFCVKNCFLNCKKLNVFFSK